MSGVTCRELPRPGCRRRRQMGSPAALLLALFALGKCLLPQLYWISTVQLWNVSAAASEARLDQPCRGGGRTRRESRLWRSPLSEWSFWVSRALLKFRGWMVYWRMKGLNEVVVRWVVVENFDCVKVFMLMFIQRMWLCSTANRKFGAFNTF